MENEETIRELVSFTATVGRTLSNHRDTLQRHELILLEAYQSGLSHKEAITDLRELVAAQSQLLESMQRVLLRIVKSLGMNPEDGPDSIN